MGKDDLPKDFMTCIRLGEVFPAAAGAFIETKTAFLGFYGKYQAGGILLADAGALF